PVYNTEEFLKECINSVLKQTYNELEILLMNNGSTDDSLEIIKQFQEKDDRIRCIDFAEKIGVGAARNYGIKTSQGNYVYFLDSDDYLPENTIKFLLDHIDDGSIIRGKMKTSNYSSSFAIVYHRLFKLKHYSKKKYVILKNYSINKFLIIKKF